MAEIITTADALDWAVVELLAKHPTIRDTGTREGKMLFLLEYHAREVRMDRLGDAIKAAAPSQEAEGG